jgi:hypothetical protein
MINIPIEILKVEDELRDGFHALCRVHIEDKEFRMLIDTGASMTMFNIKKSKEISKNVAESNNQKIMAVGSKNIESKFIIIDEMRIGDVIIKNYKTILIDLNSLNEHFKIQGLPPIDGIIGGDILMKYNAVIDYKKREMILNLV